ncbi:MAG: ATP:cob(I)alamin adenosyltransferase [Candidatus Omnitrophota bacterium]
MVCLVFPGATLLSSLFDVAMPIARRLERVAVKLFRKGRINNKHILIYLNHLSDLFFLLARSLDKKRPHL